MDYFKPDMTALDANKLSMLALAHVGDAVYELLTRTMLCTRANSSVAQLHKQTVSYVNAPAQARAVEKILRKWDEGVPLGRVAVDLAHGARDHGDMIDVALDGHRADQLQCVIEKMRIDLAAEHIQLRALAQHLRLIERIGFL